MCTDSSLDVIDVDGEERVVATQVIEMSMNESHLAQSIEDSRVINLDRGPESKSTAVVTLQEISKDSITRLDSSRACKAGSLSDGDVFADKGKEWIEEDLAVLAEMENEREGNKMLPEADEMDLIDTCVDSGCTPATEESKNVFFGNENLAFADGVIVPVRDDVSKGNEEERMVFVEGNRIRNGASTLRLHDEKSVSLPYLDTSENGMLHVIPGWTQREFIEDISYRYHAGRKMKVEVPFLRRLPCEKRTYDCAGVLVCSHGDNSFKYGSHCTIKDDEISVLKNIEIFEESEMMKRNAINIFRELQVRKGQYCKAVGWRKSGVGSQRLQPTQCTGEARIVKQKEKPFYGGQYFVGCTGFFSIPGVNHYFRKLDSLDESGVEYLGKLLSGEEQVPLPKDVCTYVHGKKRRGASLCETHKLPLEQVQCRGHKMVVFEPIIPPGLDIPNFIYVSCIGAHTHPPPPPPQHTVRKMKLVEVEEKADPKAPPSVICKRVEEKLLGQKNGNGADCTVSTTAAAKLVRGLRQKRRPVLKEAEGLLALVLDTEFPYCREMKIVDGKDIVVTGTVDPLLLHASRCEKFCGDATFKTITEKARSQSRGKFYLYNIVAPARCDGGNSKGVVVFRALMTGLSAEVYRVIWRIFLKELIRFGDYARGEENVGCGVLTVPYQPVPPALSKKATSITSITTDFDAAEVRGCALALEDICGGTADSHVKGIMIGCSVHLDRDPRRRSSSSFSEVGSGMTAKERFDMYSSLVRSETEEAGLSALDQIAKIDSAWVKWVRYSGLLPMISPAFSNMSTACRANGYGDTNVVESHNRKGNNLCGVYMHPVDAMKELFKLDEIEVEKICSGKYDNVGGPRAPRIRKDFTLAPSSSKSRSSGSRKRSSGRALGPAQNRGNASAAISSANESSGSVPKARKRQRIIEKELAPRELKGSGSTTYVRVQQMICDLVEKTTGDMTLAENVRVERLLMLNDLLVEVSDATFDEEAVKRAIFKRHRDAIKLKDTSFIASIFNLYSRGCLGRDTCSSIDENNSAD